MSTLTKQQYREMAEQARQRFYSARDQDRNFWYQDGLLCASLALSAPDEERYESNPTEPESINTRLYTALLDMYAMDWRLGPQKREYDKAEAAIQEAQAKFPTETELAQRVAEQSETILRLKAGLKVAKTVILSVYMDVKNLSGDDLKPILDTIDELTQD